MIKPGKNPVKTSTRRNINLKIVGSMSKYSPKPPKTPDMILFDILLKSLFFFIFDYLLNSRCISHFTLKCFKVTIEKL